MATRAVFRADAPITCLAATTDGRTLLAGDSRGRVLILGVRFWKRCRYRTAEIMLIFKEAIHEYEIHHAGMKIGAAGL
jgi:hypothetical protein